MVFQTVIQTLIVYGRFRPKNIRNRVKNRPKLGVIDIIGTRMQRFLKYETKKKLPDLGLFRQVKNYSKPHFRIDRVQLTSGEAIGIYKTYNMNLDLKFITFGIYSVKLNLAR